MVGNSIFLLLGVGLGLLVGEGVAEAVSEAVTVTVAVAKGVLVRVAVKFHHRHKLLYSISVTKQPPAKPSRAVCYEQVSDLNSC